MIGFTGPGDKYGFLSNFWEGNPIRWQGRDFSTAEHAFHFEKMRADSWREAVWKARTPGEAKRLGRRGPKREDWEDVRFGYMAAIVLSKFDQHPDLRDRLLATGNEQLVEVTNWHDTTWGVCVCSRHNGRGDNRLGEILMQVRRALRSTT
jgi:ribA/ribD-fused uncharacterized protein